MAPKGKNKAQVKAAAPPEVPSPQPSAPKTIGEKLQLEFDNSRPLQKLFKTKGWTNLTTDQKLAYSNALILESRAYQNWPGPQQKEFLILCEKLKIPIPLPVPKDLGLDSKGRKISTYSPEEYEAYEAETQQLDHLIHSSWAFKRRVERANSRKSRGLHVETISPISLEDIEEERQRRVKIAAMERGKKPGRYGGDPDWDDVVPIPQDDGENPLAAIAYTDEYAEAISYLRAIMARNEHSERVLSLTAHIISLNPAHYTVWLYRASTLFVLGSNLLLELSWVNTVSLQNQKNYQIWHHRQLLVSHIFPTLTTRDEVADLARSEIDFVTEMFEEDSKNYHVWSYRQYLVRQLSLFPSQTEGLDDLSEIGSVETLVQQDVRNNSAWSHRFFVVFSDPGICTEGSKATEPDPKIPQDIIEREVEVSKSAIWRAPNNQSPWNYLRGVLRKAGKGLADLECFAGEFVNIDGDVEEVKSSHALDFLADVWAEQGETGKAEKALTLLSEKYDIVRSNYWEYRRESLALKR